MHRKLSRRIVLQQLAVTAAAGHLIPAHLSFAAEPPKPPQPASGVETEYRRPELLAIGWLGDQVRGKKSPPPEIAWRPDGTKLSKEELAHLDERTRGFAVPYFDPATRLRPLLLVFRIDERASWKQSVAATVVIQDRRYMGGSHGDSLDDHLALSSIAPFRNKLRAWPANVDIEVRTQVEEPEMLLRLDEIPKGKVQIDTGVSWSVEPTIGIKGNQRGLPAAVTRWSPQKNPLNDYSAMATLKDGTLLDRHMVHPNYEISRVIEADNPIVSVEFWCRRYRLDRYENVPTFIDHMPK